MHEQTADLCPGSQKRIKCDDGSTRGSQMSGFVQTPFVEKSAMNLNNNTRVGHVFLCKSFTEATYTKDDACVPSCGILGLECGDDGCGGSCGTCTSEAQLGWLDVVVRWLLMVTRS